MTTEERQAFEAAMALLVKDVDTKYIACALYKILDTDNERWFYYDWQALRDMEDHCENNMVNFVPEIVLGIT